eukprot:GFUD01129643.1.p1 GENE.GFUD01129643.1~~GFUD01129643.1.p1  ORF type:complete len:118 (-),score=3.41 GFUD01129643.1:123-476(-)
MPQGNKTRSNSGLVWVPYRNNLKFIHLPPLLSQIHIAYWHCPYYDTDLKCIPFLFDEFLNLELVFGVMDPHDFSRLIISQIILHSFDITCLFHLAMCLTKYSSRLVKLIHITLSPVL